MCSLWCHGKCLFNSFKNVMTNFCYHSFAVWPIESYYVPFSVFFFVLFSCLDCNLIGHCNLLRKALFRTVGQRRRIFFHLRSCWAAVVLLFLVVVWLFLVDGLTVHLCNRSCYLVFGMAYKFHLWGWRWRQENLLLFCCILLLFLVRTF